MGADLSPRLDLFIGGLDCPRDSGLKPKATSPDLTR
jgi:hypothetical protein